MINIAVLGSTRGTDMQAIIDEIEAGKLDAKISVIISNKEKAYILERARKHNIKAVFIPSKGKSREEFDKEVLAELEKYNIDLIFLIGYMRILSPVFVKRYRNKIFNIHPSLLPAFAGGMDKEVHKKILESGVKITGCTLHIVDESVDGGPIFLQKAVEVGENDTIDSLKAKVQKAEQEIILKAIRLISNESSNIM